MWWHTVTHGRGSEGETGDWSGQPVPFTLPRNMVYPALLPTIKADAQTSAASGRLNWHPRRFKWTPPFCQKTKSGFWACAITVQLASTLQDGGCTYTVVHTWNCPKWWFMYIVSSNWHQMSQLCGEQSCFIFRRSGVQILNYETEYRALDIYWFFFWVPSGEFQDSTSKWTTATSFPIIPIHY
jgi:hypothetical protein